MNAPFGEIGASCNGIRFGGAIADLDAVTEVQWSIVRPEIAP